MEPGLPLRTMLFAPGSDERKLAKALAVGADAVVADLEDSVSDPEKPAARTLATRLLREVETRSARLVRINGADTEFFAEDVAAVAELELDAIVLPKASPSAVSALGEHGPPIVAIVETAMGLRQAYEIASAPRVARLSLGAVDLGAALRLEPRPDGQELLFARSTLVVDSAAAGIPGPIDVVYLNVKDPAGLEAECRFVRSLGFRGKASIHPDQVEVIQRAFAPSAEDVAWAERVVAAYEEGVRAGRGAITLDDEMIDKPVVDRARKVLAEAKGGANGD